MQQATKTSTVTAEQAIAGHYLSGARGDFVASLGKKIAECRAVLERCAAKPEDENFYAELLRKMKALGQGARLFRFQAMAEELERAREIAESTGGSRISETNAARIEQALADLPALAWGETPRTPTPAPVPAVESNLKPKAVVKATPIDAVGPPCVPTVEVAVSVETRAPESTASETEEQPQTLKTVLVLGDPNLATCSGSGFAVRSAHSPTEGIALARQLAPEVILVDADKDGADAFVEILIDDPLTEAVPLIVLGTFARADEASRFVALGVHKVLRKPLATEAVLAVIRDVTDGAPAELVALGTPSLEELTERMVLEIRQGLLEGTPDDLHSMKIPLGEGTEVMAAIWSTLSRIRELVSEKTLGAIRFTEHGPEGVIPVAPWLDSSSGDRSSRSRSAADEVRLEGRTIVVADDDPGVTWFLADLLRAAGAVVHEARDGKAALDLSYRVFPDLVISDILMPKLDGFSLSRTLKRDIALRDTPIILLSWKDDLLQRVRELGASADGYLRKESDTRAIVSRVREVLWPRARVENRLRAVGEVRGRLDGLSARSLLALVCAYRPDSRLIVQDATYLYEIEIRGGAPRHASRLALGCDPELGPSALAGLLGVAAGRFFVTTTSEAVDAELSGTLEEQILPMIARARGAMYALTGKRLLTLERVCFDLEKIRLDLRSLPENARTIIERLAAGVSPREILAAEEVELSFLEDLLSFIATRGIIDGIFLYSGADALTEEVHRAADALSNTELDTSDADAASSELHPGALETAAPPPTDDSVSPPGALATLLGEVPLRAPLLRSADIEITDVDARYGDSLSENSLSTLEVSVREPSIPIDLESPATPLTAEIMRDVSEPRTHKTRSRILQLGAMTLVGVGLFFGFALPRETRSSPSAGSLSQPATEEVAAPQELAPPEADLGASALPTSDFADAGRHP